MKRETAKESSELDFEYITRKLKSPFSVDRVDAVGNIVARFKNNLDFDHSENIALLNDTLWLMKYNYWPSRVAVDALGRLLIANPSCLDNTERFTYTKTLMQNVLDADKRVGIIASSYLADILPSTRVLPISSADRYNLIEPILPVVVTKDERIQTEMAFATACLISLEDTGLELQNRQRLLGEVVCLSRSATFREQAMNMVTNFKLKPTTFVEACSTHDKDRKDLLNSRNNIAMLL